MDRLAFGIATIVVIAAIAIAAVLLARPSGPPQAATSTAATTSAPATTSTVSTTTAPSSAQSGPYRKVYIGQSVAFAKQFTVTLIGIAQVNGQPAADFNTTSGPYSRVQLIGQRQYMGFGQNHVDFYR